MTRLYAVWEMKSNACVETFECMRDAIDCWKSLEKEYPGVYSLFSDDVDLSDIEDYEGEDEGVVA